MNDSRSQVSLVSSSTSALKLTLFDNRQALTDYVARHLPPSLQASFDPADIVQDVYFEALRRVDQFVQLDTSARQRWLMSIARLRMISLWRRHKASRRAPQHDNEDDSLVCLLEDLARYERTPSASAASHETHIAVQQSFERLEPAQAQAIRWRLFDGLSHGEVAAKIGKTESAAKQLFHYALGALRKDLASALSLG